MAAFGRHRKRSGCSTAKAARLRFCVRICACLEEDHGDVNVTVCGSLHKGGGGSRVDRRARIEKHARDIRPSATASGAERNSFAAVAQVPDVDVRVHAGGEEKTDGAFVVVVNRFDKVDGAECHADRIELFAGVVGRLRAACAR